LPQESWMSPRSFHGVVNPNPSIQLCQRRGWFMVVVKPHEWQHLNKSKIGWDGRAWCFIAGSPLWSPKIESRICRK
jgi:hypothetical protein